MLGAQKQRIEELEAQVEELRDEGGRNSGNSSKSPSSDSAAQRAARREKDKGAGRRARASARAPSRGTTSTSVRPWRPRRSDASHDYLPNARCAGAASEVVIDAEPRCRHQVFDLPEVAASVVEHRLYSGTCSGCGRRHAAQTPCERALGADGPGADRLHRGAVGQVPPVDEEDPGVPGRALGAALLGRCDQRGAGPGERRSGAPVPGRRPPACVAPTSSTPTKRATFAVRTCTGCGRWPPRRRCTS